MSVERVDTNPVVRCADEGAMSRWLFWVLISLVAFGLYGNLARLMLGTRYVLVFGDAVLMSLACYTVSVRVLSFRFPTYIEALTLCLLVIGTIAIFHPNLPNLITGLEGFRQTMYQMLAVFVGAALLNTRRRLTAFFKILGVLSLPVLFWAVKQFLLVSDVDRAIIETSTADPSTWQIFGKIRSFGFFSGPFHMGLFAGFAAWIGIALYLDSLRKSWLLLTALAFMACAATLTRASVAALFASLLIVPVFVLKGRRGRIICTTAGLLALLLVGAVVLAERVELVGNVLEGVSAVDRLSEDSRLQGRFDGYHEGITVVGTNPFGIGMGSAGDAMGSSFEYQNRTHITSHNIFLRFAIETGWIGLGLFLAIVWTAVAAARRLKSARDFALASLLLGWLVVLLVTGITGSSINAYPANLLLWVSVGGIVNYSRSLHQEESDD